MNLSSWFSNLKSRCLHGIKVTQTDTGSHGIHWSTIFDPHVDANYLMSRLVKTIETGQKIVVAPKITVMTGPVLRGIVHNDEVVTGFPYIKGYSYQHFKTSSITEWSHADNLEAVIEVSHASGCALSFFATDYAVNKQVYKTQKNLTLNVIGLVYELGYFNAQEWNRQSKSLTFSQDFCGYFPKSEDEIQFIGRIRDIKDHALGDINGHSITIGITPDFAVEFFIAHKNLSINLEKNTSVHGIAWMQGTLEK